jgi:type I restriction enzyme S subunit
LLSARNVRDGFLDLSKVDYISDSTHEALQKRVSVKAGDVLLSCSGSVGRSCVFPENLEASFVRSVAIIRPATVDSKYLSYCLRSPDLQSQVQDRITTTGQPNIFQGKIKTLSIPVAPPSEQAEIVNRIDHAFAWLDKIATEHARAEHLLPKLDQTILAKAFRGELVPQDPNDEPASVLLERIKATPTGTAPRRKKASN